jgi:transcriptional regulator with XRE-family HTH domain
MTARCRVANIGNTAYSGGMVGTENAGDLLRSLRRQQGRSLRTAAADIGVAPSQLSRLERGERGLGPDVSERIALYYGVPAEVIALSHGDIPADVVRILQAHPELITRLRAEYVSEASKVGND